MVCFILTGCRAQPEPAPITKNDYAGPPEVVVTRPASGTLFKLGDPIEVVGRVRVSDLDLVSFGTVTVELIRPRGTVHMGSVTAKLEGPPEDGWYRYTAELASPKQAGPYAVQTVADIFTEPEYSPEGKLRSFKGGEIVTSDRVAIEVN